MVLTIRQRTTIIWLLARNVSQREIGFRVGCDPKTVRRIGQTWLNEGRIEAIKPPGRPRKTTTEQDQRIIEAATYYKFDSIEEIMRKIRDQLNIEIDISRNTGNKRLLEAGLNSRVMAHRPKLTENSKRRRVEVAEENVQYDNDIWRKTIFIDEISIETGPNGKIRVRRLPNTRFDEDNILEVQSSGWRSIMCVACFSFAGIGPIIRSNGNFNSEQYVNYLEDHVLPYAEHCFPDMNFYILQDNSRVHTSYHSLGYLVLRLGVDRVIPHAPQSPDCNPIENLFGLLIKKIKKNRQIYANVEALWNAINLEWNRLAIDTQTIENLALSMPSRYAQCS